MSYTYDPLARLKTAGTTGSTAYPQWGLSWDYDRYGNRLNQNVTAGTAPANSLSVNPASNRITSAGFSYDASGNMTQDGLNTYTYDAESRITQVNSGAIATYTYDGAGLRVKKVAGSTTTRYIFSGTKVIAEYTGATPTLSKEYIYAGSQLLATLSSTGVPTYHHPDHLSVRVNTDSAGTVVGQQGHYPFGESWYSINTTTKWQFTSYERDGESGLDYAMFRYDSSRLGRFLTPDPLTGSVLNPQSLNRYAYVGNDPVNFIDPLGLQWGFVCWAGRAPFLNTGDLDWSRVVCGLVTAYLWWNFGQGEGAYNVEFWELSFYPDGRSNACPPGSREISPTEAQQILNSANSSALNQPYGYGTKDDQGKVTFNSYGQRCNQYVCNSINSSGVGNSNVNVSTSTISNSSSFVGISESQARAGDIVVYTGGPNGNHMGFLVPGEGGALDVLSATASQNRPDVPPNASGNAYGGPRPLKDDPRNFQGKKSYYRLCVRE